MFQDWELFSNAIRQGIHQQCFEIENSSAMLYQDKIRLINVLGLAAAQQCNMTRSRSAKIQDWEHLSNVIRQGIHQECFKNGFSSAM